MENLQLDENAYSAFVMAIRSPITRQKYLKRLGYFLSFLGINDGNIENSCKVLGQKSKADSIWLTNRVAFSWFWYLCLVLLISISPSLISLSLRIPRHPLVRCSYIRIKTQR